jgi:hypothetical protein
MRVLEHSTRPHASTPALSRPVPWSPFRRVISRSFAATNDDQSKSGPDKRQPNSAASSNMR